MLNDARLYCARLRTGAIIDYTFAGDGFGWLQVACGRLTANGLSPGPCDALAVSLERTLSIIAEETQSFVVRSALDTMAVAFTVYPP